MTAEAPVEFRCPTAWCCVFPYESQELLDEHIRSGKHVYPGQWHLTVDEATWVKRGDDWFLSAPGCNVHDIVPVLKRDGSRVLAKLTKRRPGAEKDLFEAKKVETE